ncbi:MAG: thiamine pyrophosphate-dependent dehydrogenase E1 component subunit alpha [Actinomycetota bacterium]
MDLERLYLQMARMRAFELAIGGLWKRGLISGEMHLGTGEEAVIAGVLDHLTDGDSVSLDHRSTPALVGRRVDMTRIILELLGDPEGLCSGMGGHMHLFCPARLAASSGIVGSSVPLGAGFALATQHLRPGKVAVAFLGEGAMNQGMAMEALNLAAVWKLPLIVVCKDNRWSITTRSGSVTAGNLADRARLLGVPGVKVNGLRVEKVWGASEGPVARARAGEGPSFIHARCVHLDGHFLGDPVLRIYEDPIGQVKQMSGPLLGAAVKQPGAGWTTRAASLGGIGATLAGLGIDTYTRRDPVDLAGRQLEVETRVKLDEESRTEVNEAVANALEMLGAWPDA